MTGRIWTSTSFTMAWSLFSHRQIGIVADASLNDLVDMYDRTKTSLLNKLAPSCTKTYRVRPSNVWFDDECLAANKLSRFWERQYKSSNLGTNRISWINQLRSYHRLCDSKWSSGNLRLKIAQWTQRRCGDRSILFWVEQVSKFSQSILNMTSKTSL